jgi:uncharacterized membrane protein YbhN (UPF0104 family)
MTHAVAVARGGGPWARWWPWLRWAAVLAIIAALISLLGTKAFAAGLKVLTPTAVLAAVGIGLLTTVLNALRWRLVARRVGLQLRLGDAIAETYRAIFLNAVLPGGVLGDVDRAVRHGRSSGDIGRGARAVAIERTAGQLVLIAAAAVVIPAEPALVVEIAQRAIRNPLLGIALLAVAAAVVAVLVVRSRRAARSGRWRQLLGDTAADVRAGVLSRGAWPLLIVLSAAALGGYLLLFLVAARSAGATAPTPALLPPLLLALIAMGLPISIGGWGPREGVAALSFWMAGLGAPLGVTTSVAYGALALIASLPGAAVLLARRLARSRRAAAEAPTGPIEVPRQRHARHRRQPGSPAPTGPDDGAADRPALPSGRALGRRRPLGHGETG